MWGGKRSRPVWQDSSSPPHAPCLKRIHLRHHACGFLFEPGNAQQLADKIEFLLRLPQEELDVFKRNSLAFIQAHDLQRTIVTFERLYRGASDVDAADIDAIVAASAAPSEALESDATDAAHS